jgi:hypothetical protein
VAGGGGGGADAAVEVSSGTGVSAGASVVTGEGDGDGGGSGESAATWVEVVVSAPLSGQLTGQCQLKMASLLLGVGSPSQTVVVVSMMSVIVIVTSPGAGAGTALTATAARATARAAIVVRMVQSVVLTVNGWWQDLFPGSRITVERLYSNKISLVVVLKRERERVKRIRGKRAKVGADSL